MSLLGPPEPYLWVPEGANVVPDGDAAAMRTLLALLAVLARRGRPTMDEHRAACRARLWLDERLKEGRVEAAEVRYALGLPLKATRAEVLAAIRARGGQP